MPSQITWQHRRARSVARTQGPLSGPAL